MADSTPKSYHTDPTLWLYTSLTSGSSHIISATSRMQTILKANKIEFQALDVATDEKARMLWGRRAGKRKLPGLVRFGMIVGDLEEVEEWNEYGELKDNLNMPGPAKAAPATPTPSASNTPSKAPIPQAPHQPLTATDKAPDAVIKSTSAQTTSESASAAKAASTTPSATQDPPPLASGESTLAMAMRQAGFEAAKKAGDAKTKARQDELERLKAKSADMQKLDNSGPTGMPPPSGTTEAEEAKKPESGVNSVAGAADKIQLTKEEKEEEAVEKAAGTEDKSADNEKGQTEKAAEQEMTKSANEATAAAAEPEVLVATGQVEPEEAATKSELQKVPSVKEPEVSAPKTEPQRVLNAKEAEEEANKAIIADEATHVHIAGSPPPYASPGMKYPRDEEEDTIPPSAALKDKVKNEGMKSNSAAESKGKLAKEEDETGKVDTAETTDKTEDGSKPEAVVAAPAEQKDKVEEATEANAEQNKTGAVVEEPTVKDTKAESKATVELLAGDRSEMVEEAMPKTESDISKDEGATEVAKSSEPEVEATTAHEKQDLPETKAQAQPVTSGEKAGESVAD